MNSDALWLTFLILLPALGLVLWAWRTMSQFEEELRAFSAFERADFEIGALGAAPQAVAAWPGPASRQNAS